MFRSIPRHLVAAIVMLGVSAPLTAHAAGDVSVTLTAHRVTRVEGREVLASAERAKPGETIEYRATYHNAGRKAVTRLEATLPIPAGVEYVASTAAPGQVMASLDGKRFAPAPLTRRVRTADGREVVREIPAAEYRWLRWTIGNLNANQSRDVVARVRVTPTLAADLSR